MIKKVPANFYRNMFVLAIPMAIQNIINVGVSSSDIIMLGNLSENAMSSVSMANQLQFVMSVIMFGISSGATVLNAQYWGKSNIKAIEMVLGISMRIALMISAIFSFVALVLPEFVMKVFTSDAELIELGKSYLTIIALTYIIQTITVIFLATLKSMEMVLISTIIYTISFFVNIVVNYCLIFGKFGFPQLGVRGAAIGTATARCIELIITLIFMYNIKDKFKYRFKYSLFVNKELRKDFYKFSIPIVCNELLWSVAVATATAIYGHINQNLVAANSVAQVSRQLFMVFSMGLSTAAALIIGKKIGEKNYVDAELYAKNIVKLVMKIAICMAIILFLTKGIIIRLFKLSELSGYYLNIMLIVMCFYLIAQAYSCINIIGIFRAGGDTKYGMYVDIGSMWLGSLLISYLCAFILKLPSEVIIVTILLDEFIKIPLCFFRYKKKVWLKDITREGVENNE